MDRTIRKDGVIEIVSANKVFNDVIDDQHRRFCNPEKKASIKESDIVDSHSDSDYVKRPFHLRNITMGSLKDFRKSICQRVESSVDQLDPPANILVQKWIRRQKIYPMTRTIITPSASRSVNNSSSTMFH
ncbi:hypothetical protein ACH5RR_013115 [Cinchona calisaya]|uniref:Uncharacterized protein n=1 Tax=Cinchona calisaya TaxID=153742 RepID=A0ABD2ZZL8_9GENT